MTIGMKRCITDVDAANLSERARLSRLLLVEDNSSLLTTLMAILEDEGFAVTGCATATEALVHIQRQGVRYCGRRPEVAGYAGYAASQEVP